MKIVAIKNMSAGNESVGEMWQETKIFEETTPVVEIIRWASRKDCFGNGIPLAKNLVLTVADDS
jgi:hypothetical protein